MEGTQEKIKQHILKLLDLLKIEGTVAIDDRNGQLFFNITSEDSNMLIGHYGQNLKGLQHLARLLARKDVLKGQLPQRFYVDVGDYRKERGVFLEALARKAASRVRETKQTLILKPMNSSDRKMIHVTLSNFDDLITESVGDEPERRIVIKLKE
ncbi:MAG: hypothetical protein COT91_05385 [Candidatus Doudnabacteria bacterium CG10_big_fil_rev_8_21_14_0_10_41_10]|uniref:R3H domain-containing protein n=1 Tax=Candidatus Doudnabacteria bacterium CG10_big_fil_rev_8_21_14_0_10_41_10 TaxID=1974551 RepID=A0A2H0VC54_9BACT|nr:MAG: hypothetical protein COT91_05385 [Candidatus Doudnabacteria bacterium CG10_big_fil_rev_8_21_14_0_10_41_10]